MEINTVKNGLYIDYRESLLITNLKDKVEFKTENMIIGDIIFYKENDIMLLIERKTIFDLVSSIKDGRLRDQTSRILDTINPEKCVFLIEGSLYMNNNGKINGTPTSTLYTTIFNKLFRDNVKIMNSCSINETALIIKELYDKFINDKTPFNDPNVDTSVSSNIIINNKPRRKGDITEKDCFLSLLCQIPSISNIKAKSITDIFSNMKCFIQEVENNSDKIVFISTIKLSNGNNLGVKSAEKIIRYLGFS